MNHIDLDFQMLKANRLCLVPMQELSMSSQPNIIKQYLVILFRVWRANTEKLSGTSGATKLVVLPFSDVFVSVRRCIEQVAYKNKLERSFIWCNLYIQKICNCLFINTGNRLESSAHSASNSAGLAAKQVLNCLLEAWRLNSSLCQTGGSGESSMIYIIIVNHRAEFLAYS